MRSGAANEAVRLRGGRQGAPAPPAPPARGMRPLESQCSSASGVNKKAARLRGGRQGWAATPAPPARGAAPGNPNLMLCYAERLTHTPLGRCERQVMIQVSL